MVNLLPGHFERYPFVRAKGGIHGDEGLIRHGQTDAGNVSTFQSRKGGQFTISTPNFTDKHHMLIFLVFGGQCRLP